MRVNRLLDYGFLIFLVSATAASLAVAPSSVAAQHGGQGMQGAAGHHGAQQQGHGAHKGQGGHHGKGGKQCRHGAHKGHAGDYGKKKLFGPHWKTTLSPEQAKELDRLRVEYAKVKVPLKAKAKAIKLELAALATADELDAEAANARIDELLALKREMMRHEYTHIAAKRTVLTPEQRVSFDMDVLKRAKHKGEKRH